MKHFLVKHYTVFKKVLAVIGIAGVIILSIAALITFGMYQFWHTPTYEMMDRHDNLTVQYIVRSGEIDDIDCAETDTTIIRFDKGDADGVADLNELFGTSVDTDTSFSDIFRAINKTVGVATIDDNLIEGFISRVLLMKRKEMFPKEVL